MFDSVAVVVRYPRCVRLRLAKSVADVTYAIFHWWVKGSCGLSRNIWTPEISVPGERVFQYFT